MAAPDTFRYAKISVAHDLLQFLPLGSPRDRTGNKYRIGSVVSIAWSAIAMNKRSATRCRRCLSGDGSAEGCVRHHEALE